MMNHKLSTLALLSLVISSGAFAPAPGTSSYRSNIQVEATASVADAPYFVDVKESPRQEERLVSDATARQSSAPAVPKHKKIVKKAGGGAVHKEGIFSPVVLAAKAVLGEEKLNKVRAKAISMHSDVISSFVDTHDTPTGQAALKTLFRIADKDGNGTISTDELAEAFQALGFNWLKEKQVNGIFKRADIDENGAIDLEEFVKEAPKTLRTNLIKLAKTNGGELGFLV